MRASAPIPKFASLAAPSRANFGIKGALAARGVMTVHAGMRASLRAGVLAALLLGIAAIEPVQAQSYPSKTIKLIVPFGPGGPTDVAARLVSQIVQSALGQSVVIENRPGAGGATGTKAAAGADPDGYTLLIGTSATLGVVPALVKNPGYDPIKSFAPVAKVADSTTILIVPSDFPANSIKELVAYEKAN